MAVMHRFASVLLVDRRGWLLLQERDERPVIDPEKWGLVGGHVEDGEDYGPGASRELAEETGIRLEPGELTFWREFEIFHESYGTHDTVRVFVSPTPLGDEDVVVGEGRRIVFVEPAAAAGLDLTAAAAIALPALLDSELYRSMCA